MERDDDLIARIDQREDQIKDALLGSRRNQNLISLIREAILALELLDDRVFEIRDTFNCRIARKLSSNRINPGISNVGGRIEVGFAGAQCNDVFTCGFELRDAAGECDGGRRLDALNATGSSECHWDLDSNRQ